MAPFSFVPLTLVPARAYENHLFVAYANRCGREGELQYIGLSCIVGPDGVDIARAGPGEEVIRADLDLARLRSAPPLNTYLKDRRPELYTALVPNRTIR
jgi:predicted amidohydrolase